MPTLKELVLKEEAAPAFGSGHSLCRGCGIPTVVRTVLGSIPGRVVVVNATGCLEVATTRFPFTAWQVPWIHVAFENAAAVASGVEAAYQVLKQRGALDEPTTIVVFAGDGGTYDIGLQALSGALERGHRFIYVCYDNEAYMNTGIQRSSATPYGASTTTSPVGSRSMGKPEDRKRITDIVIAHHIPYVAQAAMSHFHDLSAKAARAAQVDGPAFLNVLSACPPGWGYETRDTVKVIQLAVDTGFWPLYEVDHGHWRITYEPPTRRPLVEWLAMQRRFRHLLRPDMHATLDAMEQAIADEWAELRRRHELDEAWFLQRDAQ